MTPEFTNTLFGFVGWALVSTIVTRVWAIFEKRIEYKRALRSVAFNKKIEAAEKAVAFYATILARNVEIKRLYQIMAENNSKGRDNPMVIQSAMKENGLMLLSLIKEKHFEVNPVHLYFDLLDNNFWNEEDAGNLIKKSTEVGGCEEDLIELIENQQFKSDKWDGLFKEYIGLLKELIAIYQKNTDALKKLIILIRKQIASDLK